jgi:pilus assembly protein FimV
MVYALAPFLPTAGGKAYEAAGAAQTCDFVASALPFTVAMGATLPQAAGAAGATGSPGAAGEPGMAGALGAAGGAGVAGAPAQGPVASYLASGGSGCGCRAVGSAKPRAETLAVLLAAVLALAGRSRRRRG